MSKMAYWVLLLYALECCIFLDFNARQLCEGEPEDRVNAFRMVQRVAG